MAETRSTSILRKWDCSRSRGEGLFSWVNRILNCGKSPHQQGPGCTFGFICCLFVYILSVCVSLSLSFIFQHSAPLKLTLNRQGCRVCKLPRQITFCLLSGCQCLGIVINVSVFTNAPPFLTLSCDHKRHHLCATQESLTTLSVSCFWSPGSALKGEHRAAQRARCGRLHNGFPSVLFTPVRFWLISVEGRKKGGACSQSQMWNDVSAESPL